MKHWLNLIKDTYREFGEDKAQRLGAALAYYTIFSIAPLLLIAIAIAGLVFGREAVQGQVVGQLQQTLGAATAKALQEMIRSAARPKSGIVATIIGIITLLFGAGGVFQQLKDALNTIWNVEPQKSGIAATIRRQFLSITMVLGIGFLLLVSLVLDAIVNATGKYASATLPGGGALWEIVQLVVSFAVITVLFAMMFRYLPDTRIEWRDVWFGALFTAVLFVIGKFVLGLYLGRGSIGSAYGAAGSLILLLLWVYWSAQVVFFGAEFTQVYARTHGSRIGDTSKADARRSGVRVEDRPKIKEAVERPRLPQVPARAEGKASGSRMKVALGSAAGVFVGAILGSIGVVVMALKIVKKLGTFH